MNEPVVGKNLLHLKKEGGSNSSQKIKKEKKIYREEAIAISKLCQAHIESYELHYYNYNYDTFPCERRGLQELFSSNIKIPPN